jgi:hypothetical protein
VSRECPQSGATPGIPETQQAVRVTTNNHVGDQYCVREKSRTASVHTNELSGGCLP